ncbi:GH3 auxin-responsive promoter family protein, partial [Flavobacteriales bacterium]|nr:GH3 auxin-responsive promoter family protein [Flavobacteriales bacterium]
IPLSKETLYNCHYKGGKDMLALYLESKPNSKIFDGKGIILGGYQEKNNKYIDADLSAILLKNFPFWVNMHRIPDIKTAVMKDWNKKLEEITNQSINQNITNISGVPSWMLLLLQNIVLTTGTNNISEIWPNLELYMHGGINFSPYQNQFNKLIPSGKMNYLETYNASEGFFAIQDRSDSKDMLLMLDYGIFYEFIKKEEVNNKEYETFTIENIKEGIEYAIVITTNSGLWRYLIGDIIEFTSTNPFRLKIKGRIKNCINTFGEELMVSNTDYAIKIACQKTDNDLVDYSVAPIYIDKEAGGHEWVIELSNIPQNIIEFKKILDLKLKEVNSDYEAKRFKNLIIKNPKINLVKKGVFYKWLEKNKKLGGQNKIARLSEDRKFIEELILLDNISFQQ